MMWGIRVQQQYNQLLDGTLGFADMETSYWHHLSSLNTWWRWRGLALSWRLHCSCSSLMAPLRDSYLTALIRRFVSRITLLIRPPSAFCSPFSSRAVFKSSVLPNVSARPSPPFRRRRTPAPWHWRRWQRRGSTWRSRRSQFLCHLVTSDIRAPRKCHCRFVPPRWRGRGARPLPKHNPCAFTNRW